MPFFPYRASSFSFPYRQRRILLSAASHKYNSSGDRTDVRRKLVGILHLSTTTLLTGMRLAPFSEDSLCIRIIRLMKDYYRYAGTRRITMNIHDHIPPSPPRRPQLLPPSPLSQNTTGG